MPKIQDRTEEEREKKGKEEEEEERTAKDPSVSLTLPLLAIKPLRNGDSLGFLFCAERDSSRTFFSLTLLEGQVASTPAAPYCFWRRSMSV